MPGGKGKEARDKRHTYAPGTENLVRKTDLHTTKKG